MIYQESVMRVAQQFAGYSLAQADNLRKACGKKQRDSMVAERQKFEKGAKQLVTESPSASSCSTLLKSSLTMHLTKATHSATADHLSDRIFEGALPG